MPFSDKAVLITGASSGIGAGLAIHFSKLNAKLVLVGRNEDNLKTTAVRCTGSNIPLIVVGDVTNEEDLKRVVEEAINRWGKLDVLLNNAGLYRFDTIQSADMNIFDQHMNLHIRSVYQLTALVVPHLIKTKGNIINITSMSAFVTIPGSRCLSYSMSKAAIHRFTRFIAIELAPKQVRVNCVSPGITRSNIFAHLGVSSTDAVFEQYAEKHPLGRLTTIKDIADAVEFLASEKASFITGVCLPVDGGGHICPQNKLEHKSD